MPCLSQKLNVTDTMTHIEGLEPNSTYHVFVIAANSFGESLPSSMLLFNVSEAGESMSNMELT